MLYICIRSAARIFVWGVIGLCLWWWVVNIMLDYSDGPPVWTPEYEAPAYVVQKDGSVVLLPPVQLTAPPAEGEEAGE